MVASITRVQSPLNFLLSQVLYLSTKTNNLIYNCVEISFVYCKAPNMSEATFAVVTVESVSFPLFPLRNRRRVTGQQESLLSCKSCQEYCYTVGRKQNGISHH
jgi:hypothetical protein